MPCLGRLGNRNYALHTEDESKARGPEYKSGMYLIEGKQAQQGMISVCLPILSRRVTFWRQMRGRTMEIGWGIITTKDHSEQNSAIGLHISSMPSISLIQQKQHYQPLLSSPA